MSAAAVRAPARDGAVLRHYLRLLARGRGAVALMAGFALTMWIHLPAEGEYGPYAGVRACLWFLFFLPAVHWPGARPRSGLDAAMPLDTARHDALRVAAGTAWAAATLGAFLIPNTLLASLGYHRPFAGYPAWYPAALLVTGLTVYLYGAAAWLSLENGESTPLTVGVVGAAAAALLLPPVRAGALVATLSREEVWRTSAWTWVNGAGLWLALAVALVGLASSADRLLPRWSRGWRRAAARGRGTRARPWRVSRAPDPAAPRRPARPLAVLGRHFAALSLPAGWVLVLALAGAAWGAWRELAAPAGASVPRFASGGYDLASHIGFTFMWPVLVWADDRATRRRYEDALPAPVLEQRLLRVLAGALWLELVVGVLVAGPVAGALAAGTLGSPADAPAWFVLGIPCAHLLQYLAGSLPVLAAQRNLGRWNLLGLFVLMFAAGASRAVDPRFSLGAALAPLSPYAPTQTSWAPAALFWLALLAGAVVAAAAVGVQRDRELPWSPAAKPAPGSA